MITTVQEIERITCRAVRTQSSTKEQQKTWPTTTTRLSTSISDNVIYSTFLTFLPPPQSNRSSPVGQPPGPGHPQRLPHVGQPGLDRPIAACGRGPHGGAEGGGLGLRAGARSPQRVWGPEGACHLGHHWNFECSTSTSGFKHLFKSSTLIQIPTLFWNATLKPCLKP